MTTRTSVGDSAENGPAEDRDLRAAYDESRNKWRRTAQSEEDGRLGEERREETKRGEERSGQMRRGEDWREEEGPP